MYIQLMHRSCGVHSPIKHIEIPCSFYDVYRSENNINEELLISNIPEGWLPVKPLRILITVVDENGCGTGQLGLNKFRNWAKYFDSYVLELLEEPCDWWEEDNNE